MEDDTIYLSAKDYEKLVDSIDNPSAPNERLVRALKEHQEKKNGK